MLSTNEIKFREKKGRAEDEAELKAAKNWRTATQELFFVQNLEERDIVSQFANEYSTLF